MERLSTGKRINGAADDAAGVAIASRLTSEITGTNMAIRNAMDGQALIDTAEGSHAEIGNILQRMRELAVQSANDTNDSTDRANLQVEIDQLVAEIDRISQASTWAGQQLLDGDGTGANNASFNLQIGSGNQAYDTLNFTIGAMSSSALGLDTSASLTVGSPDVGATNASVSVSNDVITVASGYEDDDITIAQTVGGSASTAMGLNITDAAGVISVAGTAFADADVFAIVPAAMTSVGITDDSGVLTIQAGIIDVSETDMEANDGNVAGSLMVASDNTLTFGSGASTAVTTGGTQTITIDGRDLALTITTSDNASTQAAKAMDAINGDTSNSGIRATVADNVVTLERIGIAADQAGDVEFLIDGVSYTVTLAAGDTIEEIAGKITTDFNDTSNTAVT